MPFTPSAEGNAPPQYTQKIGIWEMTWNCKWSLISSSQDQGSVEQHCIVFFLDPFWASIIYRGSIYSSNTINLSRNILYDINVNHLY